MKTNFIHNNLLNIRKNREKNDACLLFFENLGRGESHTFENKTG